MAFAGNLRMQEVFELHDRCIAYNASTTTLEIGRRKWSVPREWYRFGLRIHAAIPPEFNITNEKREDTSASKRDCFLGHPTWRLL